MDDTFIFKPKDYGPAIRLALNADVEPPIKITGYYYDEYQEVFQIMIIGHGIRQNVVLQGDFVRGCFKAVKRGISSWS